MPKQFEFLFDVGGPNGYLVHKILPQFCAEHGLKAVYVPVLLGGLFKATGNRAPMIRYADAPAKLAYEQLEFKRFIDAYDIPFRFNPHFPVNSLLPMRMLVGAQQSGCFAAALDAVMDSMWLTGQNLADPEILVAALDNGGLEGNKLIELAGDPDIKAQLVANTESAVARGAFGIPTFLVGDALFFGKERLAQVAEACKQS
jgi:2-hydroxychromene-2-carboxylate isomerase